MKAFHGHTNPGPDHLWCEQCGHWWHTSACPVEVVRDRPVNLASEMSVRRWCLNGHAVSRTEPTRSCERNNENPAAAEPQQDGGGVEGEEE